MNVRVSGFAAQHRADVETLMEHLEGNHLGTVRFATNAGNTRFRPQGWELERRATRASIAPVPASSTNT